MKTKIHFKNGYQSTEALVTALKYDNKFGGYKLSILGIGSDGYNYTNFGNLCLDNESMDELIKSHELELPHEIIGKKIRLVATIID